MPRARTVTDTILGEAVSGTRAQRFRDMLGIASVIANRAALTGKTPQQIVSAPGQFSAYGKALPAGTEAYRGLAQQALNQVQIEGPIHNGTFYATAAAAKNLPSGLKQIDQTVGHNYYSDPQNRAIRTAVGYVTPAAEALSQIANKAIDAVDTVTAPARNVAANVANMGSAMRMAAFPSVTRPSVDIPSVPTAYGLPARAMSPVSFNLGPKRPNPPGQDLVSRIQTAVTDTLGPRYGVDVYSGQGEYGSNRHRDPAGIAADVHVVDTVTGKRVNDPQAMMDVAQAFAAQGGMGVGYGPKSDYMGLDAIHLDTVTPGPGQDNEWGSIGNANAGLLADARKYALMPASFYDANLPASMQVPGEQPETMMAAPVSPVERAPLGPVSVPSVPSVPQRPATPTPAAALASMSGETPSVPSGLGFMSQAAAATLSPQDMQAAVNLGALPAGGTIPGMTSSLGQPPSFSSPMMMAAAPAAPTQTFSPPSVPAMPSRPVTPTPPAALAAMNNPAVPSVPSSLMAPGALGPLSSLAPPDAVQPTFTPAIAPEIAPPPAAVPTVPTVPNVISAPAQQAVAAAAQSVPSMARAADVYSGAANMGMANDGSTVSRDALGRISVTNKFGATTTTLPGGFQSVSFTGVPSVPSAPQAPTIAGPLSQTSIPSVPGAGLFGISPAKTETGNLARGLTGAMAGSALGSLAGPIGSLIGAALGKSIAQGKNPLDAFSQQRTPGLSMNSFPTAPSMAGALGGTQSNRSMEGMRSISPGAAAAIGRGVGGLY